MKSFLPKVHVSFPLVDQLQFLVSDSRKHHGLTLKKFITSTCFVFKDQKEISQQVESKKGKEIQPANTQIDDEGSLGHWFLISLNSVSHDMAKSKSKNQCPHWDI